MKKIRFAAFSGIILIATLLISCTIHSNFSKPSIEGAVRVYNEACYACHEPLKTFRNSIHDRIASFETGGIEKGCESCHGPGSKHAETGDPNKILSFSKKGLLTSDQKSELCLQCHTRMDWRCSEHPAHDVSCTDCHIIHGPKIEKLLTIPEPSLCFNCHQHIKAKIMMPNHHPIWEGQKTGRMRMTCSDCHDPHGSEVRGLKTDERLNDLCLKCHARYQGPYVFEHEPVTEDCCICHDPHGSIADNLLKQNEPFLCLECHQFHFHAGKQGYEGTVPGKALSPYSNYTEITSNYHSWKAAWTTKCTQCHTQIHGSDLPSQSVPGRGEGLTR